jgi:hypothetical protein
MGELRKLSFEARVNTSRPFEYTPPSSVGVDIRDTMVKSPSHARDDGAGNAGRDNSDAHLAPVTEEGNAERVAKAVPHMESSLPEVAGFTVRFDAFSNNCTINAFGVSYTISTDPPIQNEVPSLIDWLPEAEFVKLTKKVQDQVDALMHGVSEPIGVSSFRC